MGLLRDKVKELSEAQKIELFDVSEQMRKAFRDLDREAMRLNGETEYVCFKKSEWDALFATWLA